MSGHDDLSAVSIVVLSHNRKDALEPNLVNLFQMVNENGCELVVVDNASTDGSKEMILAFASDRTRMKALLNERNIGVAGGRNAGWRVAGRDCILNIDDDTIITADAVAALLSLLQSDPQVGIASPRILHARTRAPQLDLGDIEYRLGNFHGACHMLRRSLLEKIGFNDEACTFGGEELDLSIRARAAGQDVVYSPSATVLHDNRARQGREGSDRRARWLYNFTRVHHKHFPLAAALPLSFRYLLSHLVSGVRALGLGAAPMLAAAAWSGFRDGRRQHSAVPDHVVQFYTNPALQPDLGNVPLLHKLKRRLRRI